MALVYVGLGSNLGDRAANIREARQRLAELPGTVLIKNAALYETRPVGGPAGQGDFLNSASLLNTSLEPAEFLAAAQEVERAAGRSRQNEIRWGPRVIDIDILFWDDIILVEKDLVIPHPRVALRAFALLPMADLNRDLVHPVLELTINELVERVDAENEGIRRISL